MELLEKKQAMEELFKERRKTKVERWRDTVAAEGGVTQKAPAGSRSSEAEGDLFVSEVGVHQRDTEGSKILWPCQGAAAEKKSSRTCRVGGDT